MKGKLSDIGEIIWPIGLLFLGYSALKNLGIVGPSGSGSGSLPVSNQSSPACPRGPIYRTELWKDCDPGYLGERSSWIPFSPQDCKCTASPAPPPVAAPPVTPPYIPPAGDGFGGGGGGARSGPLPVIGLPVPINTNQWGESGGGTYPSGSYRGPGGIVD